MRARTLLATAAAGAALLAGWETLLPAAPNPEQPIRLPFARHPLGGREIESGPAGHEYRQDDLPAIAASPDGSIWVAWLSFAGDRDDVGLRRYRNGNWSTLHWTPATSGDSWLPQVAADRAGRVWVVWSQQVEGNWDIYARRFDPSGQAWGPAVPLSSDPLPDIHPRVASNGKGRAAVVWQGFRGGRSSIFLRTLEEDGWSAEVRVTQTAANEWEPAAAIDSAGGVWVVYDSYRNGNYDVFLAEVREGRVRQETAVAVSPRFEARATVAVDTADRVWVAWEAGDANWGKDNGYVIRDREPGVPLGGFREVRLRCLENRQWREPAASPAAVFGKAAYAPHVFSDGQGSVYLAAVLRQTGPRRQIRPPRPGYYEAWIARLEGGGWSKPAPLPASKGRLSTRLGAAVDAAGGFWLAWSTDNRGPEFYHRPVRQQVQAGRIAPGPAAPVPVLGEVREEEEVEVRAGHPDENGDIRALRGYRAVAGGKSFRILRGDFHRHTELSWDTGGNRDGSLQDLYRYMIDAGGFDYGATTDHQGGAWPYWWWYTQKMNDMYFVPGAYVPVYGYERSASYPNGHRNVLFVRRSDARVTPFFLRDGVRIDDVPMNSYGDESADEGERLLENDTKLLYEEVRGRNAIVISHSSGTVMGTDWRDNDPLLEPVVEIFQGIRTSYEHEGAPLAARRPADESHIRQVGHYPAGMVSNAWAKGYRLGVIASSDHVSTHFSYAMVYTEDFSRQGILDAYRRRHTYGATDNILLDVRMGAYMMGDEFTLKRPQPLRVLARGTRPVARVEVIKDGKVVYAVQPGRAGVSFEFTDAGEVAGRHYYYVRLQQDDRMTAWSSPMFIQY